MKKKEEVISNIIKKFNINNNHGYSLMEILVVMVMMGIVGAVVAPQISFNNESKAEIEGRNQLKNVFQQARQRAISQTSAIRIMPDPDNPDTQIIVEFAKSKGCASLTKLTEDANGGDTELKVLSTDGFSIADTIKVGSDDTDNEITGMDSTNLTFTLGLPLGSSQGANSSIELANNWESDFSFQKEDLTLPQKKYNSQSLATFISDVPDWKVCFNSRGVASIYDGNLAPQPSLTLTVTNTTNNLEETLTLLKGGAIETN